jgi:large subunit ribosomal protein L32
MAHPKRKISKTRRDKRRTHYKAEVPSMNECSETGEIKLPHRAAMVKEGNKKVFFYNGRRFD